MNVARILSPGRSRSLQFPWRYVSLDARNSCGSAQRAPEIGYSNGDVIDAIDGLRSSS
jgi:hypothetical protein